jgi:hypothetical protein
LHDWPVSKPVHPTAWRPAEARIAQHVGDQVGSWVLAGNVDRLLAEDASDFLIVDWGASLAE